MTDTKPVEGASTVGPPRFSIDIAWSFRSVERYIEDGLDFDITRAKRYLSKVPIPIRWIPAPRLAAWMHRGPGRRRKGRRVGRIDPTHLVRADPGFPLLVAEISGKPFLVDGHHRLEYGLRQGWTEFRVLVIRDRATVLAMTRDRSSRASLWWHWTVLRWWQARRHRRSSGRGDGFSTDLELTQSDPTGRVPSVLPS